jgi:hypothetical protein
MIVAALTAGLVWIAVAFDLVLLPSSLLLVVVIVGVRYYRHHRCPKCGSRLNLRRDYFAGSSQFRIVFDCSDCQIVWVSGTIGTDQEAS